ncbi:MAG: hypothetical protein Q4F21_07670 [Lachnospiraceae bacterium]|nr:hypothetical protein [Lachnospiraceae bacterium]
MSTLTKKEKAEKIVERINSNSFAKRLIRELNFYGELESADVIVNKEHETQAQMIIPLDEMNVLEADEAESYSKYLDVNFERIWENILADESLKKLHMVLEKMPEHRRNMQLYLTNYCPEFFKGESLGLMICY